MLSTTGAQATESIHKSYVCKYVRTPGEAEQLQTGQNPIWVDNHSLLGHDGETFVGQEFSDKHTRSVVVIANTDKLTPEPPVSLCSPPQNIVAVPGQPTVNDPCGPNNISFNVPADTATLNWTLLPNGDVKVEPQAGYVFDQEAQSVTFHLPPDSNTPCPETIQIPAAPSQSDPCGPNNATWNLPADTATLDWSLVNGVLSVSIIPANVTFTDGTRTHSYGTATDSNVPCPTTTTITPPGAPPTTDPCGPSNIAFVVPADTATLNWTLLGNGDVTVAPQAGYVFSGNSQLITFTLPADSNVPCIAGVEEISPKVTFTEPDCDNLDGADWSGNLTDLVDYSVDGTPGLGESVTVTATIKASAADDFAFPAGFDNTFEHTYVTEAELACPTVKGSESTRPKPQGNPTVLGTQAVAPTAVNAGLTGLPATGSSSNTLLAQLMVGGGMILLLAGGWLGFGRREYGAHQA